MGTANRTAISTVRESTIGTTPPTPRMRSARITGESLQFGQQFIDSEELRSDRMLGDPIKVMASSSGSINFEVSYPNDNSPESDFLRSAFYSPWVNTPAFDNDGTAELGHHRCRNYRKHLYRGLWRIIGEAWASGARDRLHERGQ